MKRSYAMRIKPCEHRLLLRASEYGKVFLKCFRVLYMVEFLLGSYADAYQDRESSRIIIAAGLSSLEGLSLAVSLRIHKYKLYLIRKLIISMLYFGY